MKKIWNIKEKVRSLNLNNYRKKRNIRQVISKSNSYNIIKPIFSNYDWKLTWNLYYEINNKEIKTFSISHSDNEDSYLLFYFWRFST